MFATQSAIKYLKKNIVRYVFLGVVVLAVAVTSVVACRIASGGLSNTSVVETIELRCDININENGEPSIYKLTVAGYLKTGQAYTENIPPVVYQSFDLITNGPIEAIEDIVLCVYLNGEPEPVKYDCAYAYLKEIETGAFDGEASRQMLSVEQ
jgi:predicted ABC-type transport system involved in lysophospholipase L1 biosynthesis ATPase subunit